MKTVCKKLLCLMLVAMLLVSAVPAAFAAEDGIVPVGSPVHGENGEHTWNPDTKVVVAATCTEAGYEDYTCTLDGCGQHGRKVIPALGHKWEDADQDPTCNTPGFDGDVCSTCGEKNGTVVTQEHNFIGNNPCTHCGAANPNKEEVKEENLVDIDIYEVDTDNNANFLRTEKNVDINSYSSQAAMVKDIYGSNYSDFSYRDGMLKVWPVETSDGDPVYQLKVYYNNGTSYSKQFDINDGEGILAAIKDAGIKPSYEDHVLVGYSQHMNGNAASCLNQYHTTDDVTIEDGIIKVYAVWRDKTDEDDDDDYEYGEGGGLYGDDNSDPIYDVVLYIYTNGKTSSYAKKVTSSTMGRFTKDGVLTDDEVQLVVENYFKTNSNTKYYGLFDKETWNSGNYLTKNAEYEVKLNPDKTNYVYVMVKDAKAYVADSSNPKTGDNIMIAVTTMALAAAALVSMVELKKRKMI